MLTQDYWENIYSSCNDNAFEAFEAFEKEDNKYDNYDDNYEKNNYDDNNYDDSKSVKKCEQNILYCDIEKCSCGDVLVKNTSSTLICNNCGTIRDIEDNLYNDDGGYLELPVHRKMRIIGEDSAKYRSDLFRCSNSCENELQVKCEIIFEELVNIYEKYMTNKKISTKIQITKNNLKDVAIYYTLCTIPSNGSVLNIYSSYGMTNERDIKRYTDYVHKIQNCIYHGAKKRTILRSANKKETLAALLFYVCLTEEFTCPKHAISEMFLLEKDGFAMGEKYVRFFISQKKIDLDLNISRIKPEINTLFNAINEFFNINEETEEDYKLLKKAICAIHEILEERNVAERSCVKSQIIGASYVVIKRCKNKTLIPQLPDIIKFCSDRIRKSTVEKFITEMNSHHSAFMGIYKEFKLDDERW